MTCSTYLQMMTLDTSSSILMTALYIHYLQMTAHYFGHYLLLIAYYFIHYLLLIHTTPSTMPISTAKENTTPSAIYYWCRPTLLHLLSEHTIYCWYHDTSSTIYWLMHTPPSSFYCKCILLSRLLLPPSIANSTLLHPLTIPLHPLSIADSTFLFVGWFVCLFVGVFCFLVCFVCLFVLGFCVCVFCVWVGGGVWGVFVVAG